MNTSHKDKPGFVTTFMGWRVFAYYDENANRIRYSAHRYGVRMSGFETRDDICDAIRTRPNLSTLLAP